MDVVPEQLPGAELRALRESFALTRTALAELAGIDETDLVAVETAPGPDEAAVRAVIAALDYVGTVTERFVERAREATSDMAGTPILLYVFDTDADLWAAHPDFAPLTAAWHRVTSLSAADELAEELGIDVDLGYRPDGFTADASVRYDESLTDPA